MLFQTVAPIRKLASVSRAHTRVGIVGVVDGNSYYRTKKKGEDIMFLPNTKLHLKKVGSHFKEGFKHFGLGTYELITKTPKHLLDDKHLKAEVLALGLEVHDAKVAMSIESEQ